MNMVVIGIDYFHYSKSFTNAFNDLGCNATFIPLPIFDKKALSLKDYLNYKKNRAHYKNVFIRDKVECIIKRLENELPDIVFFINVNFLHEYINVSDLLELKRLNIMTIACYLDSIKRCENIPQHFGEYSRIYVFEKNDIEYMRIKYGITPLYMPIGVAEEVYSVNKKKKYKYDICFVGNSSNNRLTILEQVAHYAFVNDLRFIVYGSFWEESCFIKTLIEKIKFRIRFKYLYKYITNRSISPQEVAELYAQSKISLNIHIPIHNGVNPRTFEILANGNFELCDDRTDLAEFGLVDGVHLACFNSADDCVEKIKYYLMKDGLRETIGANGEKLVNNKFTIKKIVLKCMGDIL